MASAGPYGKWIAQAPGEAKPPLGQVKLRLFCAPPAGMGGACFHGWSEGLPPGVEVMPLELPARGTRMAEGTPYASSIADLARKALEGVGREVLGAVPFVLLGHSFGSWVVYEMAQELARREADGWPQPVKVYTSACRAPQLADVENDADREHPTLGDLSGEAFWAAFEDRYGRNPDLKEAYVKSFVEGLLRADFGLLESYEPSTLEPLKMPLCGLCARGDNRCTPSQLSAWAQRAGAEGFRERWFEDVLRPGWWATEHRYVVDCPQPLLRFLHADLPLVGSAVDGYSGFDGPLPDASQGEAPGEEWPLPCARRRRDADGQEGERGSPCALL